MSKIGTLLASVALVAFAFSPATAQYVCVYAPNPPTIDADLSDWQDESGNFYANPLVFNDRQQCVRGQDNWQSTWDLSGTVYLMWDDSNIYIAAEVLDNVVTIAYKEGYTRGGAFDEPVGFRIDCRSDAVQIALDPENGARTEPGWAVMVDICPVQVPEFDQIEIVQMNMGEADISDEGAVVASRETEHGYIVEAMVPTSLWVNAFGVTVQPVDGLELLMEAILSDCDDGESRHCMMLHHRNDVDGPNSWYQGPENMEPIIFVKFPTAVSSGSWAEIKALFR